MSSLSSSLLSAIIIMTFELHRIKNSLMNKDSQQRIQTSIMTFIIIMIKFLSNNIKFLMFVSFKSFILKTLSLKISSRLSILLRSIHDISCDILIDSAVSKTDKEKNLRKKVRNISAKRKDSKESSRSSSKRKDIDRWKISNENYKMNFET